MMENLALSTWNYLTFFKENADLRKTIGDISARDLHVEFWAEWDASGGDLLTDSNHWEETRTLLSETSQRSCHGIFDINHRDDAFRQIEFCKAIGANILVVHPNMLGFIPEEENLDTPIAFTRDLIDRAGPAVTIALENVLSFEEVKKITTAIPELKMCLDTGHTHLDLKHSLTDYVETFGNKIIHLHIHDNHGHRGQLLLPGRADMDLFDEHLPPGEGTIDWDALGKSLRKVHYAGAYVLEIRDRNPTKIPDITLQTLEQSGLLREN